MADGRWPSEQTRSEDVKCTARVNVCCKTLNAANCFGMVSASILKTIMGDVKI